VGDATRDSKRSLTRDLGLQQFEPLDGAAPAHSRVNGIPTGTQLVALGLQVETPVIIKRWAAFFKLRPDAGAIGEYEVDLVGS
jgi:hypothetical protein